MFYPPEGRTFLAQWGKFSTSCLWSGRRKNEPKIEIQMEFCRVLKILLDGCQKKVAWSDPTPTKTRDASKRHSFPSLSPYLGQNFTHWFIEHSMKSVKRFSVSSRSPIFLFHFLSPSLPFPFSAPFPYLCVAFPPLPVPCPSYDGSLHTFKAWFCLSETETSMTAGNLQYISYHPSLMCIDAVLY